MNETAHKALKLRRKVKSVTFATIEDGIPAVHMCKRVPRRRGRAGFGIMAA